MKSEKMGIYRQFMFCLEAEEKNGEKFGDIFEVKIRLFLRRERNISQFCIWVEIDDGDDRLFELR